MTTTITIDEFQKLDNDMKQYAYISSSIRGDYNVKKVDNDEKVGYYYITSRITRNQKGVLYKKSTLNEYIVYKKKTKKISVSNNFEQILGNLLLDNFNEDFIFLIKRFVKKFTKTLLKKIIEGKICTIGDIIKYNRSYVTRRIDLSIDVLYRYILTGREYLLLSVNDPESFNDISQISEIYEDLAMRSGIIKCNFDEIKTLDERYKNWTEAQDKRFDTFLRSRDDKNRNLDE